MLTVLFSDFPRETDQRFNDVFWDIMSFVKVVMGHNTKYLHSEQMAELLKTADVLVVFPEFAENVEAVELASKKGLPVIRLQSSPVNLVLGHIQQELSKIESSLGEKKA